MGLGVGLGMDVSIGVGGTAGVGLGVGEGIGLGTGEMQIAIRLGATQQSAQRPFVLMPCLFVCLCPAGYGTQATAFDTCIATGPGQWAPGRVLGFRRRA